MRQFFTVVFLYVSACTLTGQGVAWYEGSLSGARTTAVEKKKLIFAYCHTKWCQDCPKVNNLYFTDAEIQQLLRDSYISVSLDMDNPDNVQFKEQYRTGLFPSLLILDTDGMLVDKYTGFPQREEFIELLIRGVSDDSHMRALHSKYKEGRISLVEQEKLIDILLDAGDADTEKVALNYLENINDWTSEEVTKFIFQYGKASYTSSLFRYMLDHEKTFRRLIGDKEFEEKVDYAAYLDMSEPLRQSRNIEDIENHISKYYKSTEKKSSKAMRRYLINLMYGESKQDKEIFLETALDFLKDEPPYDWKFYNAVAWEGHKMTEDKRILEQCLKWTKISLEKDVNYYNLDTKASIYFKLGDMNKAKNYIKKAISYGRKAGVDLKEAYMLKEKIELGSDK